MLENPQERRISKKPLRGNNCIATKLTVDVTRDFGLVRRHFHAREVRRFEHCC